MKLLHPTRADRLGQAAGEGGGGGGGGVMEQCLAPLLPSKNCRLSLVNSPAATDVRFTYAIENDPLG